MLHPEKLKNNLVDEQMVRSSDAIGNSNKTVDFTSARFRMIINSFDYAQKYQPKIDNNDPPQLYSKENLIKNFEKISDQPYNQPMLFKLIEAQRSFRCNYFQTFFAKINKPMALEIDLMLYRLNKNPKPGALIDQVVQWFPVLSLSSGDSNCRIEIIDQEKVNFKSCLQYFFLTLLLEYYEISDNFPHDYMTRFIELTNNHVSKILDGCFLPLQGINEVCKKCGELFENKNNLIEHHELTACRLPPTHHCQCGRFFMTHKDWINHCLCVEMKCPTFAWHLWRYKRINKQLNDNLNIKTDLDFFYSCDGCQYSYDNFLQFWHHICNCPFLVLYLIGNCPQCTEMTKEEYFNAPYIQERLGKPHSDYLGIKIVQEWASIKEFEINVNVSTLDESNM